MTETQNGEIVNISIRDTKGINVTFSFAGTTYWITKIINTGIEEGVFAFQQTRTQFAPKPITKTKRAYRKTGKYSKKTWHNYGAKASPVTKKGHRFYGNSFVNADGTPKQNGFGTAVSAKAALAV